MKFGFVPDPKKLEQAVKNLRASFSKAIDAAGTTNARPLLLELQTSFEALLINFKRLTANGRKLTATGAAFMLGPTLLDIKKTVGQLAKEAQSNPAVMEALNELQQTARAEFSNVFGKPLDGDAPKATPGAPKSPKP